MRWNHIAVLLGAALGLALAAGPAANASPVDDAWPYGQFSQLPGYQMAGTGTQQSVDGIPFLSQGVSPWELPGEGSYSTDWIGIQAPFVGVLMHQKVFDSTVSVPSDGTTSDELSLPWLNYFAINDPAAGFGNQFSLYPLGENTFISDSAGMQDTFLLGSNQAPLIGGNGPPLLQNVFTIDAAGTQDVLSVFDQDFTLLDLPALSAGNAAAEFTSELPSLAIPLDWF